MKSTNTFKEVIKQALEDRAKEDSLFAKNLEKENKNLDDCIRFILNTVKDSGVQGFTDEEVFGMAAHYYDEDQVDVGGDVNCKIVMNHIVQLSEEEKEEARKAAFEKEVSQQRSRMRKKVSTSTTTQTANTPTQQSMF